MPLRILQGDVMLYLQECKNIQNVENAFRLVRMIYNRQFSEINQIYQNFEMDPEIGILVGSVTKTPKIAKQAAARKAEGGLFNMCTAMEELEQELKQKGKREGRREGRQEGMILYSKLLKYLKDNNMITELNQAICEPDCVDELCKKYNIAN